MINIALIHPQPVYRKGLSLLLEEGIEQLQVIATGSDLRTLVDQFKEELIDVVLWDIPSHHVLTPGIRVLRECFPLAKIIVLVSSTNSIYAGLLETLGANAVLPTDCKTKQLLETVLKVHHDYTPHPSSNHVQEPVVQDLAPQLNGFETTVLQLIVEGSTSNQIATKLGLTKIKVSNCRAALKRKLKARNRSALIERALELQFLKSKNNLRKT